MNFWSIKGFLIFALIAIAYLGLELLIVKRKAGKTVATSWAAPQARFFGLRITPIGYATYFVLVIAMLAGVVTPAIFPESMLGRWILIDKALFKYLGACVGVVIALQIILTKYGFPPIVREADHCDDMK